MLRAGASHRQGAPQHMEVTEVKASTDPKDFVPGSSRLSDSGALETIMAAAGDGSLIEPEPAARGAGAVSTVIDAPPLDVVWTLTSRTVAARSLQVVAELGVADHIDEGPVGAVELASSCGAEPGALDRVLRLLTAHGIFAHHPEGYRHTDASRLLRSDHPMSVRALTRLYGLPVITASLEHMDHSVRSGAPAIEVIEPNGFFAYLQAHPDEAAIFDEAMTAKAGADVAAVLGAYDFQRFSTI